MGDEIDEKPGLQSASTAHLGSAIDEIYQARRQQQFLKHPESAPIEINTQSLIYSYNPDVLQRNGSAPGPPHTELKLLVK